MSQHSILPEAQPLPEPAVAGEEILRPLEHYPQLFQHVKGQGGRPAGGEDAPGGAHPNARHPQQCLVPGGGRLYREPLHVAQGPGALGVHPGIEIRVNLIQQLLRPEVVVPQQPVRLIQPVFPEQGRLKALAGGEQTAVRHGHVGRIEHPLELVAIIESLAQSEDLLVRLRGRPNDHLGRLSRWSEAGGVAVPDQLLEGGGDVIPDLAHRGQNILLGLVRAQQGQAALRRQFDVDAQPVAQGAQPPGEGRVRPGDGLGVNVAPETVLLPEQTQHGDHPFRGVVRIAQHRRG